MNGREAELGMTVNEFYGQTECNIVLVSGAALGVSRGGRDRQGGAGPRGGDHRCEGRASRRARSARSRCGGPIR